MTKIEWCDEFEKGWLSGIIDGEGSISLLKEKRPHFKAGYTYKPRLCIANTNLQLIKKVHTLTGGALLKQDQTAKGWKTKYTIDVSANGIRQLLPHINLVAKARQLNLLKEALGILSIRCTRGRPRTNHEIERLESIAEEIRKTNGRW